MNILLKEPLSPRYIYINPQTNLLHLIVPVVGGQEISTDNTCQATMALKDFFDGEALNELNTYKNALAFDIALLDTTHPQRETKEARFAQIEVYIEAVAAMRFIYAEPIITLLKKPSNLYSIQLRPREQDPHSEVVDPIFFIERKNDEHGVPLSPLYQALQLAFSNIKLPRAHPQTLLKNAVLATLNDSLEPPKFEEIQDILQKKSLELFQLSLDFTKYLDGSPISREEIDIFMGFKDDTNTQDYVEALLGACLVNVWENLTNPFYRLPENAASEDRTEYLSILTQFFLATLNVYCRSKGISTQNFGVILDASADLSNQLVKLVANTLSNGDEVEKKLCDFYSLHAAEFGLSRHFTEEDLNAIKQKFERIYQTITSTKENPHMDDFMILDIEDTGITAKFVSHQGTIGVNFAEIVLPDLPNQNYFDTLRTDFLNHALEVPHKNEWLAGAIDIKQQDLLDRIDNELWRKLPLTIKESCYTYPLFQTRQFLNDVAQGKQEEVENLLDEITFDKQILLRSADVFTDYSGRTFNCTAYEYAYWAKDTYMCRMLEESMDEETKAEILARINKMEYIDKDTGKEIGLSYHQNNHLYRSAHFDFNPLKQALKKYLDNYDDKVEEDPAKKTFWLEIGKMQRDVPAHVAQEYCNPNRSFYPKPDFDEPDTSRTLVYDNHDTTESFYWFPLQTANSGLGFDFTFLRGAYLSRAHACSPHWVKSTWVEFDWEAIKLLDEVRTAELNELREQLDTTQKSDETNESNMHALIEL